MKLVNKQIQIKARGRSSSQVWDQVDIKVWNTVVQKTLGQFRDRIRGQVKDKI